LQTRVVEVLIMAARHAATAIHKRCMLQHAQNAMMVMRVAREVEAVKRISPD
jgi:hypothetical protein